MDLVRWPRWAFAVAGVSLFVALSLPTPSLSLSSSPFVSVPKTNTWYRIPATVIDAQGDILAFAERRDNDNSDMGNFDVVLRRSTDGGRTWQPQQVIADDGKNRVSNPVPMFDPRTGTVLLLTSVRYANNTYRGLFLQKSTDGGRTFTPLASGQIRVGGYWKGGLTGPGHGLVLAQGGHAGRIVVALGYSRDGYYGGYGIYSDDDGATWNTGYDQADTSGRIGYMEGTLAELPDGTLYVGYRDKKATEPGYTRYDAFSADGGASLSRGFLRQTTLGIHSVEGSVLSLQGSAAGTMVFSSPSFTSAADRTLRRDMAVFTSRDGGVSWGTPYPVELEPKPGSYSDLVQISDSTVGILYETGTVRWKERIVFRTLSVGDIMSPVGVPSSLRGTLSSTSIGRTSRGKVRILVTVAGIRSPAGKVKVNFSGAGRSGYVVATLTYSNRGLHYLTLPRLGKGRYSVRVTYYGNVRIQARSVSAGTLRVR